VKSESSIYICKCPLERLGNTIELLLYLKQCCSCLFVSGRTVVYRSHYKRPQFPPKVCFGDPNYNRLEASHVASHVDWPSRTLLTVRPARQDTVLLYLPVRVFQESSIISLWLYISYQRGPFIHCTECSALLPTPRIVIDCQVYKTGQYKHDAKLTHMTEPIVSISLSLPGSPLSVSFSQAIEAYNRRLLLTILTYKVFYL